MSYALAPSLYPIFILVNKHSVCPTLKRKTRKDKQKKEEEEAEK